FLEPFMSAIAEHPDRVRHTVSRYRGRNIRRNRSASAAQAPFFRTCAELRDGVSGTAELLVASRTLGSTLAPRQGFRMPPVTAHTARRAPARATVPTGGTVNVIRRPPVQPCETVPGDRRCDHE